MLKIAISIDQAGRGREFLNRNSLVDADFVFVGVDGRRMPAIDYFRMAVSNRTKPMTPAEVGCALSHMEAYQRFLESPESSLLVLEDDVVLHAPIDSFSFIDETIKKQPKDVPIILHLGGQDGLRGMGKLRGKRFDQHSGVWQLDFATTRWLWRTCGYVINRAMASLLLEQQKRYLRNADSWHEFIRGQEGLVLYYPIVQHPLDLSTSSIEAERRMLNHGVEFGKLLSKLQGALALSQLMLRGRTRIHTT